MASCQRPLFLGANPRDGLITTGHGAQTVLNLGELLRRGERVGEFIHQQTVSFRAAGGAELVEILQDELLVGTVEGAMSDVVSLGFGGGSDAGGGE